MKMKKTLAIIMTAAMTIGTMVGCSQTTLNYSNELSKTAKWEATTSDTTGAINIDAQGFKGEITFTSNGYKVNNESYVDMKFNDPTGIINIPEIKAYSDGTTSYINKSFYEGIYTLSGQPVPKELANIKEEYIGIDGNPSIGINPNQLKELTTQPDYLVQLGKMIFGDNNYIDLPYTQNGREYTLNIDANQTVDLGAKIIKAASQNFENINNTFKLGLTTEAIEEMKKSVNNPQFDASLADAKTSMAGTTISSKEVFEDNSYISDFNMNLQIKDFGKIVITTKGTSTKSDVKSIDIPNSKIKITAEEFTKISVPTNTAIPETTTIPETTNTVVK